MTFTKLQPLTKNLAFDFVGSLVSFLAFILLAVADSTNLVSPDIANTLVYIFG